MCADARTVEFRQIDNQAIIPKATPTKLGAIQIPQVHFRTLREKEKQLEICKCSRRVRTDANFSHGRICTAKSFVIEATACQEREKKILSSLIGFRPIEDGEYRTLNYLYGLAHFSAH